MSQEPVAWVFELARARRTNGEYVNWGPPQLAFKKPEVPEGSIRNLRPLGHLEIPGEDTVVAHGQDYRAAPEHG